MEYSVTISNDEGDVTTRASFELAFAPASALNDHSCRREHVLARVIIDGIVEFKAFGDVITDEMLNNLEAAAKVICDAWDKYDAGVEAMVEAYRKQNA